MGVLIFIYIISLFILYVVIETAVKRGINASVIGDFMEEQQRKKEEQNENS